jgi:hypothetical protein
MPYITRDDGERFVIPSYRDVLRVKKANLLKREMTLLASNYGDYATLQKKARDEYEVAFSSEFGYLLGETVWAYFNRPRDLIYCEAIPNTNEAILVIVKSGSVYLDGSFPIDSISEELVIFKTQQNQFDIYISGDVPISETPEDGTFYFDKNSIHSFNFLEQPIFQNLPIIKAFQLQLIDVVLKSQGIGTFPIKPVLIIAVIFGFIFAGWQILRESEVEIPQSIVSVVNPYQAYIVSLSSPSPEDQIQNLVDNITQLLAIPGWFPNKLSYNNGSLLASVRSNGGRTNTLFTWAKNNNANVQIASDGMYVQLMSKLNNRPATTTVNELKEVIASLIDRLSYVLPGNPLKIGASENKGQYIQTAITISFADISLTTLALIGQQFKGLPLVLSNTTVDVNNGFVSGTIDLIALGK